MEAELKVTKLQKQSVPFRVYLISLYKSKALSLKHSEHPQMNRNELANQTPYIYLCFT